MSDNAVQNAGKEHPPLPPPDYNRYRIAPQILAGFTANLVFLVAGMAMSWAAPSLPLLMKEDSIPRLTSSEGSWVASGVQIGACIGPIVSALLINRIGRKWFLYFSAIPNLISGLLIYYAKNFEMLFVARIISGFGVGAFYSTTPIYLGEIAENRIRGALGTMSALCGSFGSLLCYSISPWVSIQTMALISMIPVVVFLSTFVWMPETPYYYLKKRRIKDADESLCRLRGVDYVDDELKEMSEFIETHRKYRGRIWELVTVTANRRATLIIWIVLSAQQVSGVGAVMSYLSFIFEKTAVKMDPEIAVIITGSIFFIFNICATSVVDKLGRKPLLLISSGGTSLCLSIIAAYFHLKEVEYDVEAAGWIPMICVISYFIFFALGLGPVPYALLSEIYPDTVKAWATMTVSIYGSLVGVIATKIYQIVADKWGLYAILYGFAVSEFLLAIVMLIIVPETKGKSFKEIQEYLHRVTKHSTEENIK